MNEANYNALCMSGVCKLRPENPQPILVNKAELEHNHNSLFMYHLRLLWSNRGRAE